METSTKFLLRTLSEIIKMPQEEINQLNELIFENVAGGPYISVSSKDRILHAIECDDEHEAEVIFEELYELISDGVKNISIFNERKFEIEMFKA